MNNSDIFFPVDINRREITKHQTDDIPFISYTDRYFNSSYHWHWHDEQEITFVSQGSIEVAVSGKRYILGKNDGIFINSGVLHKYISGEKNVLCVMPNVVFHPSFICGSEDNSLRRKYVSPVLNSAGLSHHVFRANKKSDEPFLKCIYSAHEIAENQNWGYEFKLRTELSELTLLLCSIAGKYKNIEPSSDIYRIRTMMDFIKGNFSSRITLEDIAASAGVSVRECQRCFEKNLSTSPISCVIDMRIDHARELLLNTTESISEICAKCGFSNQSYFTKTFRLYTGFPPLKFRQNRGNAN